MSRRLARRSAALIVLLSWAAFDTNESSSGEPVVADAARMQSLLDASLVAWLAHLKAASDASTNSVG